MAQKKHKPQQKKSTTTLPIILGDSKEHKTQQQKQAKKQLKTQQKTKAPHIKKSVTHDANRVQTGIPGFDELVAGGFPKGASILVCGGPGTGKSIFCEQFVVNGAKDYEEKGLFVTFEQRREDVISQAQQFGWDIEALEKKGLLTIMSIPVNKITPKTIEEIKTTVTKKGISRLVIDSLSTLIINAPIYANSQSMSIEDVMGDNVMFSPPVIGEYFTQKFLYNFIDQLRELDGCTALLVGEADQSGQHISRDTLSEFACDGIVLITFESLGGDYSRSLTIRKMRHTKNDEDVHPMEMNQQGIVIHNIE